MPTIFPKRIGPGLLIPYLIALFFVVGIGILAVVRLGQISDTVNHVTDELAAERALADDIVNQVLLVRFNANRYVRTQRQADLDLFDASYAQLETLLHSAEQQIVDPDRAAKLVAIDETVHQYGVAFREVVQLIQARQQLQAGVLDVQGLIIENKLTALKVHISTLEQPPVFLSFGNAQAAFQEMRLSAARYLADGDERQVVLFGSSYQRLLTALQNLGVALQDPAQLNNVTAASAAAATYREAFQEIRTGQARLTELFTTGLDQLEPEISHSAGEIAASVESEFEQQNRFSQSMIGQTRLVLLATTTLAVLAGIGLGLVLYRSLAERERTELALREAHDKLELRVQERTAELSRTNDQLEQEITERKQIEREIEERRRYLEGVLRAAPDAIVTVDSHNQIVEWNQGAEKLFGYTRQEAVGRDLDELVAGPDVREEAVSLTQIAAAGQEIPPRESVRHRKDGTPVNVIVAATPFLVEGQFSGLVGVYTDITEHKRAEAQLQRYAAELQQANEEIKQFAYIVSHDLRAPLVNLKGFSAELRSALEEIRPVMGAALPHLDAAQQRVVSLALEEDVPEALHFIESSVTRMDDFIHAVLNLSRLGRRELHLEPLDMNDLVQKTLETVTHQLEAHQATVTVGTLPETVADRTSMEQIVGNLLGNAVKYFAPDRPGELEISAERGPDETAFRIRDNGRGIAADDMPKVFAPFRRIGRQDTPGEGMGLPYVQALVRRHGGRIWCESEPGVGTVFYFTISNQLEEKEE